MKINIEKAPLVLFGDIKVGEVFEFHNYYYMKLTDDVYCESGDMMDFNVVNLGEAILDFFDNNIEVREVNVELREAKN